MSHQIHATHHHADQTHSAIKEFALACLVTWATRTPFADLNALSTPIVLETKLAYCTSAETRVQELVE